MLRRNALLLVICLAVTAVHAEDEVFSGPQVGERLVPFQARGTLGEVAGKEFDLVATAAGKPLLVFFVHEVTRPTIGLTRLIMDYAASRSKDGLVSGVVFLSADPTDTENWMKRAAHALPKNVAVGISTDGAEGPGAYGLNRNVSLTVLVGKENQVTANFALIQPSIQADAPRIAKQIVEVLGGGTVPTLAELGVRADANKPPERADDPQLDALLRRFIQKTATAQQVQDAVVAIEAYIAEKPSAQTRIGEIARRIIEAGKLANYGTPPAQAQLKKWAEQFPARQTPPEPATRRE